MDNQCNVLFLEQTTRAVIISPRKVKLVAGKSAQLQCKGTGPNSKTHWSLLGAKKLPHNAIIVENVLKVYDVTKENSGIYVCTVRSNLGVAKDTVSIIVTGK